MGVGNAIEDVLERGQESPRSDPLKRISEDTMQDDRSLVGMPKPAENRFWFPGSQYCCIYIGQKNRCICKRRRGDICEDNAKCKP